MTMRDERCVYRYAYMCISMRDRVVMYYIYRYYIYTREHP